MSIENCVGTFGLSGSLYSDTVTNCEEDPNVRIQNFDAGEIAMG
jgi:hypothetical protein